MAGKTYAVRSSRKKRTGSFTRSGINASKGSGTFIPPVVKTAFEKGFGSDFSGVRIHHDNNANTLCNKMDAHAFTSGHDIFFNSNQYSPFTSRGQFLLAHELAHVKLHSKSSNTIFRQPRTTPLSGLKTDTSVNKISANLNTVILYFFKNSNLVNAYYPGSLAAASWPAAKFKVHQSYEDFLKIYDGYHPNSRKANEKIGGFYHRDTDTMHIPIIAGIGHTLHEAVHRLANVKAMDYLDGFVYEGLTQVIADIILVENKMDKVKDHNYKDNINCVHNIFKVATEDRVLKFYFQNQYEALKFFFDKAKQRKVSPPTFFNLTRSLGCKLQ